MANNYDYATTTTFIYIMAILAIVFMIVYFYNEYKKMQEMKVKDIDEKYYSECPDYWNTVGKNKCQNVNKLGKCAVKENTVMDFNDPVFLNTSTGNYAKCKWAKDCNVYWGNISRLC